MSERAAIWIGRASILAALAVAVAGIYVTWGADWRTIETLAPEGRGPALEAAIRDGWRPKAPPHHCTMCPDCCEKCNERRECCCLEGTHCACPPKDPTRGER